MSVAGTDDSRSTNSPEEVTITSAELDLADFAIVDSLMNHAGFVTDSRLANGHTTIGMQYPQANGRVEIIEQPKQRGFRFRYACEGKSHGGLPGENSTTSKKTFPSIKVHNYKGPVKIVIKIVCEHNADIPHPHQLTGKNCKDGIFTHYYKGDTRMEFQFNGLSILNVTKKRVHELLQQQLEMKRRDEKRMENLFSGLMISDDHLTAEEIQHIRNETERLAKEISLSSVRLQFEVWAVNKQNEVIAGFNPVLSEPIYDSKSPTAANLRICRMSKLAGTVTGGDEVYLLCDKVQKDDIGVVFMDKVDDPMWEGYAEFGYNDVHHQFAIVFRTPPYQMPNITEPVKVKVCLKRLSDNELSEPKEFTYLPVPEDPEGTVRKRKKQMPTAIQRITTMPKKEPGSVGMQQYQPSLNYVMMHGQDVGAGGGATGRPVLITTSIPPEIMLRHANTMPVTLTAQHVTHSVAPTRQIPAAVAASNSFPQASMPGPSQNFLNRPQIVQSVAPMGRPGQHNPGRSPPMAFGGHDLAVDFLETDSSKEIDALQAPHGPIKPQQQPVAKQPVNQPTDEPSGARGGGDLPSKGDKKDQDRVESEFDSLQFDSGIIESVKEPKEEEKTEEAVEQQPTRTEQQPAGAEQQEAETEHQASIDRQMLMTTEQLFSQVVERTVQAMRQYSQTGDAAFLMRAQRHLVASQDVEGDNMIHIAVINGHHDVLRCLLNAASNIYPPYESGINQFNRLQQTPLHIAVQTNQELFVELLVRSGASLTHLDRHGNNPLHIAAASGFERCLRALLETPSPNENELRPHSLLNQLNYEGYASIHLAVRSSSVQMLRCVMLLVRAQADVNLWDGCSGYTALHHAVETENIGIVGYLMLEAGADPNIPSFNGSSPLHLAVGRDFLSIAALLVASGADPKAENCEVVEEDEEEESRAGGGAAGDAGEADDGEKHGVTPLDLAAANPKMIRILHGESLRSVRESFSGASSAATGLGSTTSVPTTIATSEAANVGLDQLDPVSRERLAQLLDSQHWRILAQRLGLGGEVEELALTPSPTYTLLDHLEALDVTIGQLRCELQQLQLAPAIEVLNEARDLRRQAEQDLLNQDPTGLAKDLGHLSISKKKPPKNDES